MQQSGAGTRRKPPTAVFSVLRRTTGETRNFVHAILKEVKALTYARYFSSFLFSFSNRASKWIYYSNRPEFKLLPLSKLRERRLCGEHFAASAFRSSRRTRLRDNACPSVLVTNPLLKALVSPGEPVSKCLISVCIGIIAIFFHLKLRAISRTFLRYEPLVGQNSRNRGMI